MQSTIEIYPQINLKPRRAIRGMSAVLLPYADENRIDWKAFESHLQRTFDCGLVPAVNMDTGFGNLLDDASKKEVLQRSKEIAAGRDFVAGVFIGDQPGDALNVMAYLQRMEPILEAKAMPILFPSYGLAAASDSELLTFFETIGRHTNRFLGFELGKMFVPCGRIFPLNIFRDLLQIKECIGLKHSSLSRQLEWDRLAIRDRVRPEFMLLTGNDLAIDMVMYGSDYLLGLSTFAPDWFALRDHWWQQGDPRFHTLNDFLQYLGHFTFRKPVPAYKHSAAQFLQLRGWLGSDLIHPQSPRRPDSDKEILGKIKEQIEEFLSEQGK
jgi:dihydrodipicolinate synthase/N-acetylneuraminate lyase